MSEERIQRILARAGIASRRKAEELIREGRVTVNGQPAEIGGKADAAKDAIKVDGKRMQPHEGPHRYLLLNKPRGVMSTASDPQERQTVMDFVPPAMRKALVPVGRLDFDSEGLILLTDDGDFAQHVAHPRYGGSKTYEVKVKGEPPEAALDKLREGIVLGGERTSPARITRRTKGPQRRRGSDDDEGHNTWWVVELTQGRTRQIREMFQRIGHPVQKLRRVAIGPLRDPHLPVGALRELSEREVETLRRITARPKKRKDPHPRSLSRERERDEKPSARPKKAGIKKAGVKKAPRGRRP
jgi:23S rRNA pseudouridine2605 synthase